MVVVFLPALLEMPGRPIFVSLVRTQSLLNQPLCGFPLRDPSPTQLCKLTHELPFTLVGSTPGR